jgi:hypothetical protein
VQFCTPNASAGKPYRGHALHLAPPPFAVQTLQAPEVTDLATSGNALDIDNLADDLKSHGPRYATLTPATLTACRSAARAVGRRMRRRVRRLVRQFADHSQDRGLLRQFIGGAAVVYHQTALLLIGEEIRYDLPTLIGKRPLLFSLKMLTAFGGLPRNASSTTIEYVVPS